MLRTMNRQGCYRILSDRLGCGFRWRRVGKGFTLAEIMIALGILAVGMAMAAAIFPAAMEYNRKSHNSTLGTNVCENGMTMSEQGLTADVVDADANPEELTPYADYYHRPDSSNGFLTKHQQSHPAGHNLWEAKWRTGFALLARRVSTDAYQLITIAYRTLGKANDEQTRLMLVTCTFASDRKRITSASPAYLRLGGPLINVKTGEYAFVDSINTDGSAGTLDIDTSRRSMPDGDYYVLIENRAHVPLPASGPDAVRRSPVIGVLSKITGLSAPPAAP